MVCTDSKSRIVNKIIDILWEEPLDLHGILEEIGMNSGDNYIKEIEAMYGMKQILRQLVESGLLDFRFGLYLLTKAGREYVKNL
ncbi:MAG TPA: hypothetical protein VHP36_01275 [Chitinispirillaceae bacterium]|nr:hypothetical protein [Chitinispirillaceae bacterium]